MTKPRCGVPDINNGTAPFHFHYVIFPENPKWTKTHPTYAFPPGTRRDGIIAVNSSFQKWAEKTRFTFTLTEDYSKADLKISFQRLDHGDSGSRRGVSSCHSTDGRNIFHYDGDENWSLAAAPETIHLETVGLHEIGHVLGLGHSPVKEAIMFAYGGSNELKDLHQDDVDAQPATRVHHNFFQMFTSLMLISTSINHLHAVANKIRLPRQGRINLQPIHPPLQKRR
ncbi:hypothetical protein SLEP1_g14773 [Rubroshorea leprosula]|uniref:Peptidase metallopeptidase domain-containing protein n=1 Tax=Rubroshorea leprosula TaxID=152421 RepID=A0AAV5IWU2_9ROSI|nr:hypothetical protein SLEP1_g14773 [Rubroshorea leprosula]